MAARTSDFQHEVNTDMTNQDVSVPLEELRSRYGIEVSTITSTQSGLTGQEQLVEITKLVLSGLFGAILAKIGEDFWNLPDQNVDSGTLFERRWGRSLII